MKFKVTYEKTVMCEMIVEAETKEEAKKKYQDFDVIENNEIYGLEENVVSIREMK